MMGSMAYMTGPLGTPMRAGPSVIDIGAATYGVLATVAAIYDREQTGKGQLITSGLFETTVFLSVQHVAQAAITGQAPLPMPSRGMGSRLGWGVYQLFTTGDERQVFIAIISNAHWERFCSALACSISVDDPDTRLQPEALRAPPARHPPHRGRCRHLDLSRAGRSARGSPRAVLPRQLAARRPRRPAASSVTASSTGSAPQTARPSTYPACPSPATASSQSPAMPPAIGQHTREILAELGYPDKEIERLIDDRVVRADGPMLTTVGQPGSR